MSKDTTGSSTSGTIIGVLIVIAGVLLAALVADAASRLNQLNQNVGEQNKVISLQSDKITKLETYFAVIVATLNLKNPTLHLDTLITLASKKNISPENTATAITLFEKDLTQGKLYLENELHFDTKEINTIITSTPSPAPPHHSQANNKPSH